MTRAAPALCLLASACGRLGFGGDARDADTGDDASDGAIGDDMFVQWPNRPADYTILTDTTLDQLPPAGWGVAGTVGSSTGPSPSGLPHAIFRFPIGYVGGSSPGELYFGAISSSARELYVGIVWRPSDPWDGHQSGFNTVFYWHQDDGITRYNHTLTLANTSAPYRLRQVISTITRAANINNPDVTLGAWHTVELQIVLSTTASSADGSTRWWLDGQLLGEHLGINFPAAAFASVNLRPIWGGVGDAKVTDDDHQFDRATVAEK